MADQNQTISMPMRKLDPRTLILTVKVIGLKELRLRLRVGLWFIKAGCRIIGLGVEVEELQPPEARS